MIRLSFSGCKWGNDAIDNGIQINLLDEKSGIIAHIPFQGEALVELMKNASGQLTEEQKRELAPYFNGGIFLPGDGFEPGPQG
jgi:hypothetical protein